MPPLNLTRWFSRLAAAAALLLAYPAGAAACTMCFVTATAAGERGEQVLRLGILILAIPTLLTFLGVFLLAYLRRNPVVREEESYAPLGLDEEPYLPLPADQLSHSPSFF
jgi:hypothetical protein